jgi:hypothetical protein
MSERENMRPDRDVVVAVENRVGTRPDLLR